MIQTGSPMRYSEDDVRRLVTRALTLQERHEATLSTEQVRSMLTELGVSAPVVEATLNGNVIGDDVLLPFRLRSRLPALHAGALGFATGVAGITALTFCTWLVVPFGVTLNIVAGTIAAGVLFSGILSVRNRAKSMAQFYVSNTALWSGLAVGFLGVQMIAQSFSASSGVGMKPALFGVAWIFTSIAGRALSSYARDEDDDASASSGSGPLARGFAALKSTLVRRARAWLDTIQTRSRQLAVRYPGH
jgi:hypothetical protein